MNPVPNTLPSVNFPYKIAIIGEAPGADEVEAGEPFVGSSGNLLNKLLSQAQISRSACMIGNICGVRPPNNRIERFKWDGPEIQNGLAKLGEDLERVRPNVCLLLGTSALRAAGIDTGQFKISEYRGSLFNGTTFPFEGRKCIASFHPAYIFRETGAVPLLMFDILRAKEEGGFPELHLPKYNFTLRPSAEDVNRRLREIRDCVIALDIEGGTDGVTMLSIATSSSDCFVIPFQDWDIPTVRRVLPELRRVLSDKSVGKILQNSLYDNYVLSRVAGLFISNIVHDTMLAIWQIYPELPKKLGVQASIYTRQPYYKFMRTSAESSMYEYNAIDSAVTFRIYEQQTKEVGHTELHKRNHRLLNPLLYMQLKGMKYDKVAAKAEHDNISREMDGMISQVEFAAGHCPNINSPQQLNKFLYDHLQLPPQYKKEGRKKTNKKTSDAEALLKLYKYTQSKIVRLILEWKHLEGVRRQTAWKTSVDDRMHCTYNLVGTDTGRLNCSKCNDGTGANLQTVTKRLRHLYQPDEGMTMFQCDLEGADSWTVAAHIAAMGHDVMMEDLLAGVKPAAALAAMYCIGDPKAAELSSEDMRELIETVKNKSADSWPMLYFASKGGSHGTNYGMKKLTMSTNILKQSWKIMQVPLYVTPKETAQLMVYYDKRYRSDLYKRSCETRLKKDRAITAANGHTRTFFGDPYNHDTQKQAYASEPQENTTHATNTALDGLWTDRTNRDVNSHVIVEPLHHMHDALIGQFPTERTDWAVRKIAEWFTNTFTIAGMDVAIPFEGFYGDSWGACDGEDKARGIIK